MDESTIRKWWDVFVGDDSFTEIRILGKFQYSGYFKDVETLISALRPYAEMDEEQCYFVMNSINPSCYGRQQSGKFIKSPKVTTTDSDIISRKWVMIDFDPVRASGINSSDKELETAHKKSQAVFKRLRDEGFKNPVMCKSGNGVHLMYRVSFDNNEETTDILKRFFNQLAIEFTDEHVDIDQKVFNAGRLCKLYGTVAKKGADIEGRPCRLSEIVYVPKILEQTDISLFKKIADLSPKMEPQAPNISTRYSSFTERFDLRQWLVSHNISFREKSNGSGKVYELESCPWIDQHSDKKKWDSAIFQSNDGKITFNCTHSHCSGKTWRDFRLFYEPDAYEKREYANRFERVATPRPRYEIKDEIPELGSKWLSMSDIKKIDLFEQEHVKTGFKTIDDDIYGLMMTEMTILSGSTGSGKSSFLNTLVLNIVDQGAKVAMWSGELPAPMLKTWIQMAAAGPSNLSQSRIKLGSYYVGNEVGSRIDTWLDGRLFIYNNDYGTKWQQIFNDMELLLSAGVKVFVLDNLFTLDIDIFNGDNNKKQKDLVIQIKDFAKTKKVHIILVAHPRKTNTFIRRTDISGTSDITNTADNIFIIHRVGNDFIKAGGEFFGHATITSYSNYGNVIECCKNRLFGIVDRLYGIYYDPVSRRFSEDIADRKEYGWLKKAIEEENSDVGWRSDINRNASGFVKHDTESDGCEDSDGNTDDKDYYDFMF